MIVKMKFLSISGPKNDIDRVCEVYLSKYEMQLENAAAELKTTDNLQPFVEVNPYKEPLAKAEQFSAPNTEIHVTLSVQKGHQKIEVTIPVKGGLVRSEQESSDMYVSIDLVEEVIERQLRKYKNKLVAREQEGGNFKQEFFDAEDNIEDDGEIKIVRTKKFGFKPMYPEDACVQMELLGHDFYVFCNAESDEVNVVYRRKNGTFGLIEPEFS